MRLGKELAIGVIDEPAAADCIRVDEPSEGDAEEQRPRVEPARISGLADEGALIPSR